MLAIVFPELAVIVDVPDETQVTMPLALIAAIEDELEAHVTLAVESSVAPLLYIPVADNATADPVTQAGLAGMIVMPESCDDGTVIDTDPQTEPAHALMLASPAAIANAAPKFVESFVTLTTPGFEELQEAETTVCTLPSLNVPVATNRCAVPAGSETLLGAREIEERVRGVVVTGWYNSTLPNGLKLLSSPPAKRIFPLFKSVAVWKLRFALRFATVA